MPRLPCGLRSGALQLVSCTQAVDLLLCGYSCKSISPQNNSPQSILDPGSKSGQGLENLVQVVDSQPEVSMVCTENVKTMFAKRSEWDETPIIIQDQKFKDRGFVPASVLSNASCFTLAHYRTRAVGMYIKASKTSLANPPLERTFLSLRCTQLCLTDFISNKVLSKKSRPRRGEKWKPLFQYARSQLGEDAVNSCLSKIETTMPNLNKALSAKEKAVLAISVVHARQVKRLDAFTTVMVFQVDTLLFSVICFSLPGGARRRSQEAQMPACRHC